MGMVQRIASALKDFRQMTRAEFVRSGAALLSLPLFVVASPFDAVLSTRKRTAICRVSNGQGASGLNDYIKNALWSRCKSMSCHWLLTNPNASAQEKSPLLSKPHADRYLISSISVFGGE